MDTAKIKNFIIIILIFTNAFLLFTILARNVSENEMVRKEAEGVFSLFETRGIELSDSIDIFQDSQTGTELTRDLEAELAMVEAVLGDSEVENQGGNIYYYTGTQGQARFRGTGEFEVIFYNRSVEYGKSRSETAFEVLEEMGLNVGKMVEESFDGESYSITINLNHDDKSVNNANVTFNFTGNRIILVAGVRVFDTVKSYNESSSIDSVNALVTFLGIISENGYVVTEVYDLELEYSMNVPVSEKCVLTPTWRIETDTGSYRINAITSDFETIS